MSKLYCMYENGAEGYTVISAEAFYTAQTYARTHKEVFRYHDYHFEIIDDSREDEIECEDYDFMPEEPSEDFDDSEIVTREYDWLAMTVTNQKTHLIELFGYTETDIVNAVRDMSFTFKYVQNIVQGYSLRISEKGFKKVEDQLFYISYKGSNPIEIRAPFASFAIEKAARLFRWTISEIELKK